MTSNTSNKAQFCWTEHYFLCWIVENDKSNTSNNVLQNNRYVGYIYFNKIHILLSYRLLYFKKYFHVGWLDSWTYFLKSFLFKTFASLFSIFFIQGVRGIEIVYHNNIGFIKMRMSAYRIRKNKDSHRGSAGIGIHQKFSSSCLLSSSNFRWRSISYSSRKIS